MKIGIDIDNTICDTDIYLGKKIYEWYHIEENSI